MTPSFRLHSPDNASNLLNPEIITSSWLKEMARRREIPFVLIAGKYAFTDDHLAEIIRKFEMKPGRDERPAAAPRRRVRDSAASAPTVTPLRARPPQRLRRASGDGCD